MPTKHNKRKSKTHHTEKNHKHHDESSANDISHENDDSIEVEAREVHEEAEATTALGAGHAHTETEANTEDVKFEFPYSELVRAYVPKAMDVAEKAATDWKKDGSFMNLGIDNPYANMALSLGLKKAKEIEKKLDEKGVLSAVRMGVEVLKQQVNKKK